MCARWYGEIGRDFLQVVKILARVTGSRNHVMEISPLANTDRKEEAFPIMLKQFRRAIGVVIIRGNVNLKLACLHYARSTAEEAAATCRAQGKSQ